MKTEVEDMQNGQPDPAVKVDAQASQHSLRNEKQRENILKLQALSL